MKSNRLPSSTIGHNWRKCYWIACHLALQACEVLCALDSHPWMIWLSYKRPRVWPNTYWSASHRSRNVQMVWFSAMMAVIIANGNAAVHQIWMLFYTKHQSFYDEFPLKTCSFSFIFLFAKQDLLSSLHASSWTKASRCGCTAVWCPHHSYRLPYPRNDYWPASWWLLRTTPKRIMAIKCTGTMVPRLSRHTIKIYSNRFWKIYSECGEPHKWRQKKIEAPNYHPEWIMTTIILYLLITSQAVAVIVESRFIGIAAAERPVWLDVSAVLREIIGKYSPWIGHRFECHEPIAIRLFGNARRWLWLRGKGIGGGTIAATGAGARATVRRPRLSNREIPQSRGGQIQPVAIIRIGQAIQLYGDIGQWSGCRSAGMRWARSNVSLLIDVALLHFALQNDYDDKLSMRFL